MQAWTISVSYSTTWKFICHQRSNCSLLFTESKFFPESSKHCWQIGGFSSTPFSALCLCSWTCSPHGQHKGPGTRAYFRSTLLKWDHTAPTWIQPHVRWKSGKKGCFQIASPITVNQLLELHFRMSGIARSVQLCYICSGDSLNLLSPAPSSPVKWTACCFSLQCPVSFSWHFPKIQRIQTLK